MENGLMKCFRKIAGKTDAGQTASADMRNTVNKTVSMTHVLQPAYTRRLRPDPEYAALYVRPKLNNWHGATHPGNIRQQNEDSFSVLAMGDKTLLAVADGMGGHDAGEVASRIAIDAVCSFIQKSGVVCTDLPMLVTDAVQHANSLVWNEGMKRGSDMGTTLTVALITDGIAYIAHVGDSRAYWISNGSISQVTGDHSLVARLVAAGRITKQAALKHPRSNILYRTIGSAADVVVDRFSQALTSGGVLLLCTDGLWNEVSDEDIHKVLTAEQEMPVVCDQLVKMANERGGRDNITVAAMRLE